VVVEPSARTQSVEGIFEFDVVVEPGGYGRVSIWLDKPVGMVEGQRDRSRALRRGRRRQLARRPGRRIRREVTKDTAGYRRVGR